MPLTTGASELVEVGGGGGAGGDGGGGAGVEGGFG
jgi:hypothetical protein